jgi:hypothetical protein
MNITIHTRFLLLVYIGLSSMILAGCTATVVSPLEEVGWRRHVQQMPISSLVLSSCVPAAYRPDIGERKRSGAYFRLNEPLGTMAA